MKIELRDIEYFAVIAEHKHVGHAAEALGLSQSALSRSLRRLEAAMHERVVVRTPKGVELTAAGSALLSQIGRLRLAMEDVIREATDLSQGIAGQLRCRRRAAGRYTARRLCSSIEGSTQTDVKDRGVGYHGDGSGAA